MNMHVLLMLGVMVLFAAPAPNAPDPNDPQKTRMLVPAEEREKLALTGHVGKAGVQPEVYAKLDELSRAEVSFKERIRRGRDEKAFDALWGMKFRGTVYVQVEVKDHDACRRVLSKLKASQFYVGQVFNKAPGFVGHATRDALDILANSPDVVGVALDEKPLPEGAAKRILRDDLTAAKPDDPSFPQPGVKEGKVEPDVYRAFAMTDRLNVSVVLSPESLPKQSDLPANLNAQHEMHESANRKLRDRVLSTLSANDFFLKAGFSSGMSGYVTQEGLQKLWKHLDVLKVRLPQKVQSK